LRQKGAFFKIKKTSKIIFSKEFSHKKNPLPIAVLFVAESKKTGILKMPTLDR